MKNLSNNQDNAKIIVTQGAITLLVSLISLIRNITIKSEEPSTTNEACQLLIQATGIMRNLSLNKKSYSQFGAAQSISILLEIIERPFNLNYELQLNIARVLCKLTLSDIARKEIYEKESNLFRISNVLNGRISDPHCI